MELEDSSSSSSATDDPVLDHTTRSTRDNLIEQYMIYVERIAQGLMKTLNLPQALYEDYLSAGYLGLVEAASRYDSKSTSSFSAYAFLRIRGAIIDAIRKAGILSPRAYKYMRAIEAFEATKDELFHDLKNNEPSNIKSDRLLRLIAHGSLIYKLSFREVESEVRCLPCPTPNAEQALCRIADKADFRKVVASLPAKEREVITSYYFGNKSFVDIGRDLGGVSRSWVSRIHYKAIEHLRDKLKSKKKQK